MIEFHEQKSATVTVAAVPVDKKYAAEFGVIEAGAGRPGHRLSRKES